jgi:hypothetical protein
VRNFLCVRIGINDDCVSLRDEMWKEIGGKYAKKPSHISQTTDILHRVHYEMSAETVHGQSMRTRLSYSRYNRQVFASGNALLKFNFILYFPYPATTCVLQANIGTVLDRRVE